MFTTEQKERIAERVAYSKAKLGSQNRAAVRLGVNAAYVSHILNGKFDQVSDEVWRKVGNALRYRKRDWNLVETFNTKALHTHLDDCKKRSLMMAVSYNAGSGKTAGASLYAHLHRTEQVYLVKCREWRLGKFLREIAKVCGIDDRSGRLTTDDLLENIVEFFLMRSDQRPLLIIDEIDKLYPAALRALIPLFNETERELGIFLLGTENFERELTTGVEWRKKGYDEIESRIGRRYLKLYGVTKKDVQRICVANEVHDHDAQLKVWNALGPVDVRIGNKTVKMAKDLRRMARLVEHQQIMLEEALVQ
jgi:hypothetical protein